MKQRMIFQSTFSLLLAFFFVVGCDKPVQDEGEIPATIGQVQDAEPAGQQMPEEKSTELKDIPLPEAVESDDKNLATILKKEKEEFAKQTIKIPESWVRMSKENHIWADKANKRVIVRGAICMQRGLLEMFACPRETKEHEAVISVHAQAWEAHATLVALGINPGKPMVWFEEYYPVSGPIMNIEVWWTDEKGNLIKKKAQDMILNRDTGKPMECDFVFGGSEQVYDPYKKKNDYMADFGPMINVANQPDAMIDVSIESSDEAQGSLFEANTENVPKVNTKVYIVFSDSGKRIKSKLTPEIEAKIRKAIEERIPPEFRKPKDGEATEESPEKSSEKDKADSDQ